MNQLIASSIRVIVIKQNLDLNRHDMGSKIMVTVFSLLAELERDLISLRTKEALAAKKAQGVTLGKRKGTIQRGLHQKQIPGHPDQSSIPGLKQTVTSTQELVAGSITASK